MVGGTKGRTLVLGCCAIFGKAFSFSGKGLTRSVIPWAPYNPSSLGTLAKWSMQLGCQGNRDIKWSTNGRTGYLSVTKWSGVSHEDVGPFKKWTW